MWIYPQSWGNGEGGKFEKSVLSNASRELRVGTLVTMRLSGKHPKFERASRCSSRVIRVQKFAKTHKERLSTPKSAGRYRPCRMKHLYEM
jgi:hypothetical protein